MASGRVKSREAVTKALGGQELVVESGSAEKLTKKASLTRLRADALRDRFKCVPMPAQRGSLKGYRAGRADQVWRVCASGVGGLGRSRTRDEAQLG